MACNLLDCRDIQPITFTMSVRNIKIDLRALLSQIGQQNGGCRHAVYIIIAEHRDCLALSDGITDDGDCFIHILHQHRVIQILTLGMQVFFNLFLRVDSSVNQQLKQTAGNIQRSKLRRNLPFFLLFRYESKHAEASSPS